MSNAEQRGETLATERMKLTALLSHVRERVDARLDEHLAVAEARAGATSSHAQAMVRAIASLVRRGGKRLRPALTFAVFHALAGPRTDLDGVLIEIGCAWELLQAYLLIHDDWMDADETRRGGPAVHVMLREHHRGDVHLGDASAILAGDFASAMAHQMMLDMDAPSATLVELLRAFERVHHEVVLGQAIDLAVGSVDAAAVERMHQLKTASYSVTGPVELGAIVAGADTTTRAALTRWSNAVGVAFQLRDDILGVFGEARETGKPVGSDLRAGKRTAVVIAALDRANDETRARLEKTLGGSASDDDIAWAIGWMTTSGVRASVESRIRALVDEASRALPDAALQPGGRALFEELAARLVERTS